MEKKNASGSLARGPVARGRRHRGGNGGKRDGASGEKKLDFTAKAIPEVQARAARARAKAGYTPPAGWRPYLRAPAAEEKCSSS